MNLPLLRRYWLTLLAACWLAPSALAQPGSSASSSDVQIGIDGQYRVGQWTGVRVDAIEQGDGLLRLETVDGDGVGVHYADSQLGGQTSSKWRYVIPGLASAPLTIHRGDAQRDAGDASVLERLRFPDEAISADRPWLLVLGDPLGLDTIGENKLLNRAALPTTTVIQDPASLPDHWLGFEAVDVLVINATAVDLLSRLDDVQTDALLQWVRRGGKVLVTLGEAGPEAIARSPLLRELIGVSDEARSILFEPTAVEAFTASSGNPLEPFAGVILPTSHGEPLLIGRSADRQRAAIAMRYRFGFGDIVAVAADLDRTPFALWPHRTELIGALAPDMVPRERESRTSQRSGEIAYTDLAGQMRATLDRFPHRRTIPFSVAALLLLGLCLLIGPFDYFLVNRWLRRPLVGWLSFSLMIVLLSGALIAWASNADRSATVNRVEVIDIDPRIGWGRAFTWAHVFSPNAGRWSVDSHVSAALTGGDDASLLLSPFGYAGPTFGGVQITDRRLPEYDVVVSRQSESISSHVSEMPLAPVSSKGLAGWSQFETSVQPTGGLVSFRGAELRGSLKNPLPFDLLDGFLLFDDWVYLLPTRFPAGSSIDSVDSLRQKNFRWHLTRRKALESASEMEMWDPRRDDSLDRLAEILSFYDAAGGAAYTTLDNRPLKRLDLSPSLNNRQAILVGRLEQPATTFDVRLSEADTHASTEAVATGGQTVSLLRVMLPVADEEFLDQQMTP